MKIRMVRAQGGYWEEEILCDYCSQPITNIGLAMVIWVDPAGWRMGQQGDLAEPVVIHKGRCDQETFEKCGLNAPWSELSSVLERLRDKGQIDDGRKRLA